MAAFSANEMNLHFTMYIDLPYKMQFIISLIDSTIYHKQIWNAATFFRSNLDLGIKLI